MTDQHSFVSAGHFDEDLYANSRTGERVLNAAIVQADISLGFEDYLEIFNTFYADVIEVSSDTAEESIRGKDRVRLLLLNFLVPLHVVAEVGGLSISIRESPQSLPDSSPSAQERKNDPQIRPKSSQPTNRDSPEFPGAWISCLF